MYIGRNFLQGTIPPFVAEPEKESKPEEVDCIIFRNPFLKVGVSWLTDKLGTNTVTEQGIHPLKSLSLCKFALIVSRGKCTDKFSI